MVLKALPPKIMSNGREYNSLQSFESAFREWTRRNDSSFFRSDRDHLFLFQILHTHCGLLAWSPSLCPTLPGFMKRQTIHPVCLVEKHSHSRFRTLGVKLIDLHSDVRWPRKRDFTYCKTEPIKKGVTRTSHTHTDTHIFKFAFSWTRSMVKLFRLQKLAKILFVFPFVVRNDDFLILMCPLCAMCSKRNIKLVIWFVSFPLPARFRPKTCFFYVRSYQVLCVKNKPLVIVSSYCMASFYRYLSVLRFTLLFHIHDREESKNVFWRLFKTMTDFRIQTITTLPGEIKRKEKTEKARGRRLESGSLSYIDICNQ